MNRTFRLPLAGISGAFALALFAGMPATAQALTWFDGGTGVWDNAAMNWTGGAAAWTPGGAAEFAGAGQTVTIGDNLVIGSITFSGGSYTFDNTGGNQMDFNGAGIIANASTQIFTNSGLINFNAGASAGGATIQIDSTSFVNFNGAGATAGSAIINNMGQLNFTSGSTSGSSTITSEGIIQYSGTATGGTTTILNSGTIDISGSTVGGVTLTEVDTNLGLGGGIVTGLNTLTLSNGLTLATGGGTNSLSYQLTNPASTADGSIVLTGGTFTGSGPGETEITLTGPATPGAPGVPFVLIDWTAASISGVSLSDFTLATSPASIGLPGYSLKIVGTQLVLVPEPATFAMPLAAVLGMLTLRRRTPRRAI